jgi:hypothetical protein
MATKNRGRGGARKADTEDGGRMADVGGVSDTEWSKVVEGVNRSYQPDRVRAKQVEIAQVRVKVNEAKEEMGEAVAASDFIKAQDVKDRMKNMAAEQERLEAELKALREGDATSIEIKQVSRENSNSRDSIVPVVEKFQAVFEAQDDPEDPPESLEDTSDDEFALPGYKKKKKKLGPIKKVKRLKKTKPKAPLFLPESIVGKYSVLIHREDPDYEKESKETSPDQMDDLTRIDDCDENPNFALVMDFMGRFGEMVGLRGIATKDLQLMLGAQVHLCSDTPFSFYLYNFRVQLTQTWSSCTW